jgi:hypothetical protein
MDLLPGEDLHFPLYVVDFYGLKGTSNMTDRDRERLRRYREKNREELRRKAREYQRRRRAANPENAREYQRKWRAASGKRYDRGTYNQAYYAANREKLRKYNRDWRRKRRAADPEKDREHQRKWRAANREHYNEYMRKRRAADPEQYRKYEREHSRKYRASHRDQVRAYYATYMRKRRALHRELIKEALVARAGKQLSPITERRVRIAAAGIVLGLTKYQISKRLYLDHPDVYAKGKQFIRIHAARIRPLANRLTRSAAEAILK